VSPGASLFASHCRAVAGGVSEEGHRAFLRGEEHTMGEIARIIIELSGTESELVHEPLPQDDPQRLCPDIGRAKEVLSWEPRVGPKRGS
jgi:UDP-glucuronate decarboxylase